MRLPIAIIAAAVIATAAIATARAGQSQYECMAEVAANLGYETRVETTRFGTTRMVTERRTPRFAPSHYGC